MNLWLGVRYLVLGERVDKIGFGASPITREQIAYLHILLHMYHNYLAISGMLLFSRPNVLSLTDRQTDRQTDTDTER